MTQDVGFYLAVFRRRFHYFAIIAALVSAASFAVAFLLPASYRAESTLLVEGSVIPGSMAENTIQTAATEQLRIIERLLMTRANLLDIERRFDVLPNGDALPADDIVEAMQDLSEINIQSGDNDATVVSVAFVADSAQKSADVVNEYVTMILKQNIEMRTERAGETLEFFEQEVKQLGAAMDEARARIVSFQTENADALPNTLDFRLNQQTLLQQGIAQTDREIGSLRDQKDRLVAVFKSTGQVNTASGVQLSPEAQELEQLRDQLSRALAVLSAENPRVKLLKTQVAQLEEIVKRQSPVIEGENANPAATMLDIQLADIDSRIDTLAEQRAEAQKQLDVLADSIERTNQNQVTLSELEREYEILVGQYNTATDRLSRAATGERIEMLSKGERITVIDAAVPPNRPTKPNRMLIAGGGTFLGIMLGLGMIVLIELLNHAVRRPKDLQRAFGITPLTTIPYVRTPSEAVLRRFSISGLLLAAIVGIPALLYAVHVYYLPLDLILSRVASKFGLGA